ncbi:MAG: NADP-reducing hydrogenase subunit HndC [Candidatus Izimaplasma bacterium HR2]|nr:MAG: NADP-reducing hydrogenase subunit HndC [Candidatus Izimaplasma bacterium HR2]
MIERSHVLICSGSMCISRGAKSLRDEFEEHLSRLGIRDEIKLVNTGCVGLCEQGPFVIVYPEGVFYATIKSKDIKTICEEHLYKGRIVEKLVFDEALTETKEVRAFDEIKFYAKQTRVAIRNCGLINPDDIEEYIAKDGYRGLGKALIEMKPIEVVQEMIDSGLRGRGGGGFSTGLKWRFAYNNESDQKYIICNADEGDPGAFMDRALLEGDPHSILEGMMIGGYAIGADKGYVYVRIEYPTAIEKLKIAIGQAKEYGLLGKNIFGTDFSFDIEIRLGAGAFVCGEETALIASIEGGRGMSRNKPPFPAAKGLWGKPTIINNVETLANIPAIIYEGASWFSRIGTERSKGTKVFSLGGNIKNAGLVEVPMGTTLREVIYEIGGGIPKNKALKAVQTGGPSGGAIPESNLDLPIEYETLIEAGSMMGSGGMVVIDEDNCMVDICRFYLEFTVEESCGKCTPCREGTKKMLEMLEIISSGEGTLEDLDKLRDLGNMVKNSSLCGLGQAAPNPVLSMLDNFRDEFEAHVVDKKCPGGVCKPLIHLEILDNCIGCTKCAINCPVDCISGSLKQLHSIDTSACIKCGICKNICPVDAIVSI